MPCPCKSCRNNKIIIIHTSAQRGSPSDTEDGIETQRDQQGQR